jgi:hypothetical protein
MNFYHPIDCTFCAATKTILVTKIHNKLFPNRETAEKEIGHPVPYTMTDMVQYRKEQEWTVKFIWNQKEYFKA